jgi:hypothetical protein
MHIQEPITFLTDLPILLFSAYCFISLAKSPRTLSQAFFTAAFFCVALMSLFGALYHINNSHFYLIQKYGTMITGGLLSTSLALAGIFDNFIPPTTLVFACLPLISLLIYFSTLNHNSFLPFIFLQFFNIAILFLAYFKNLPRKKSILIYLAGIAFIAAGIIQTQSFHFFMFNHNDVFHLISLLSIALLYSAIKT